MADETKQSSETNAEHPKPNAAASLGQNEGSDSESVGKSLDSPAGLDLNGEKVKEKEVNEEVEEEEDEEDEEELEGKEKCPVCGQWNEAGFSYCEHYFGSEWDGQIINSSEFEGFSRAFNDLEKSISNASEFFDEDIVSKVAKGNGIPDDVVDIDFGNGPHQFLQELVNFECGRWISTDGMLGGSGQNLYLSNTSDFTKVEELTENMENLSGLLNDLIKEHKEKDNNSLDFEFCPFCYFKINKESKQKCKHYICRKGKRPVAYKKQFKKIFFRIVNLQMICEPYSVSEVKYLSQRINSADLLKPILRFVYTNNDFDISDVEELLNIGLFEKKQFCYSLIKQIYNKTISLIDLFTKDLIFYSVNKIYSLKEMANKKTIDKTNIAYDLLKHTLEISVWRRFTSCTEDLAVIIFTDAIFKTGNISNVKNDSKRFIQFCFLKGYFYLDIPDGSMLESEYDELKKIPDFVFEEQPPLKIAKKNFHYNDLNGVVDCVKFIFEKLWKIDPKTTLRLTSFEFGDGPSWEKEFPLV